MLNQPVQVVAFVNRMDSRWCDLGNEPSEALRQNWAQLCACATISQIQVKVLGRLEVPILSESLFADCPIFLLH